MQAVLRLFCLFQIAVVAGSGVALAQAPSTSLRPVLRAGAAAAPLSVPAAPVPAAPALAPNTAAAAVPAEVIRPRTRPSGFALAMDAVRAEEWRIAAALAASDGPVAVDLVLWHRLRSGDGTYAEYQDFVNRRSDWPGLMRLRAEAEDALPGSGDQAILAAFDAVPAQTVGGVLAHAAALRRAGRGAEADTLLVTTWHNRDLTDAEHRAFLAAHGTLLAAHHETRLDAMLWRGAHQNARRMLPLVSADQQSLARARMALRSRADNANALLRQVPAALMDDPGLNHARFEWRVRAGNWDDAKALLAERSASAAKLGRPEVWASRRRALARDEMRDGDPRAAYQLATRHYLTAGASYADLEWLAGYIALKWLKDPAQALAHFDNHESVVRSPISKGRAGYWKGRAYLALGNAARADMEFTRAAAHQTSFYGLLAAEAAGLPFDVGLSTPPASDWIDSPLLRDSVFQAGLLLARAGERSRAEQFWRHLADQLSDEDAARLGQAALDIGEPHLAVMIGKTVARRGTVIARPYYALHPLVRQDLPVPAELSLAIARRESEFDPVVRSGVGALGLMQLMPATAREVAGQLGVLRQHSDARLTRDPVYNAALGSRYLADLEAQFGGNVVMMSAAYNAGPSRPTRWMGLYGDPRGGSAEAMIDWIEGIPFRETRNYVMRVTESLPIYRARLGKEALPVPFSQMLSGRLP